MASLAVFSAVALAACDNGTKQQLATVAHADSVHVDSLAGVRKELLDEVMTSTQFVAEINTELAKARTLTMRKRRDPSLARIPCLISSSFVPTT